MKTRLIILTFIAFLCSCSNSTEEGLSKLFSTTQKVNTISCFSKHGNDLLNPRLMAVDSVNFYFYESSADSMVLAVNKRNDLKKRFLAKGQGPIDAVSAESMYVANGKVYFYNLTLRKVLCYDEETGVVNVDSSATNFVLNNMISTSLAFDGDMGIYPILNNENRFVIKSQEQEAYFGKIEDTREYSSIEYGWILQPMTDVNPIQKKLFWGSGMGDVYGIYDYSDINNIKEICLQLYEMPVTSEIEKTAYTGDTRIGILSVTSNQDYIFALYSGKLIKSVLRSMSDEDKLELANNILVFDWSGNPIKRIVVNHDLRDIDYDKYEGKLYGIELDGEYSLCQIPLEP